MRPTGFWLTSLTKSTVPRITAKCTAVLLMLLMLGIGTMFAGCSGFWEDIKKNLDPDSPPVIYGPIPDTAGPAPVKPTEKK